MPSNPYLSEEEIALLGELFQADRSQDCLALSLLLDKQVAPLLEQASSLELKLTLEEVMLSFPITLSPFNAYHEQAQLSAPHIMSMGGNPRSWRLPAPQHIQVKQVNGKPLAAEIRDLSISGMRLLSRRSLFGRASLNSTGVNKRPGKQTLLLAVGEDTLRCEVTLVREHKGPAFWLSAVKFELNTCDKQALSDLVFRGFLAQIEKKQAL